VIALFEQLKATAKAVAFVMSGRSLNDVLADGSVIKPQLRAGVQALSFAVLRHYGMARALRDLLAPREPTPPVDALLCTVLALLVTEPDSGTNYTEFTLVNQAVEAAKAYSKTRSSASFINAALRRFLRERKVLIEQALQREEAIYNHPQWWITLLKHEQPIEWQNILQANQIKPPLTLRVNLTKTTIEEFISLQTAQDMACETMPLQPNIDKACGPLSAVLIKKATQVPQLAKYDAGWFSVQDVAAQSAARQLLSQEYLAKLVAKARHGQKIRVLDACAAPGGKTTHLLELLLQAFIHAGLWSGDSSDWGRYFEVVAVESDAKRATRIYENLSRLKLRATVKIADAAQLSAWWDEKPFDAVLLDAPCSASGIVRRHPDIRWLRRESDIDILVKIQNELLQTLWQTVALEGRMLYATCSVFDAEGSTAASLFIETHADAKRLDSHGLWLPTYQSDGFYDALFEKIPA
jgi:16S rRNA (cytosine967-C5)-methyltransferase